MTRKEQFREIEAAWAGAFVPPYDARAELWDYGMRTGLAVFREGEKVWEQRDNLSASLREPGALERIARHAKQALSVTRTE